MSDQERVYGAEVARAVAAAVAQVTRERDDARAEVERLRAVLRGVVEALRVLPPADRASYWYRTTMDAICGAVAKVGGA